MATVADRSRTEQPALSELQSDVLAAVDRAEQPPGLREIAEALGRDRGTDERRYKQIQYALRSLVATHVLEYKTTPAGTRCYFRAGELRHAVAQLFARYGEPEAAAEIVRYASGYEWIWPHLRRAFLEAVAAETERLPGTATDEPDVPAR
jgi:hypothetical protein